MTASKWPAAPNNFRVIEKLFLFGIELTRLDLHKNMFKAQNVAHILSVSSLAQICAVDVMWSARCGETKNYWLCCQQI